MSRQDIDLAGGDIADGAITWWEVTGSEGLTFTGLLTSGSATMALKEKFGSTATPTLDSNGTAITYTASFKETYRFKEGDIVGVSVSSTSSAVGTVRLCGQMIKYVE